jgi:hypothetical protein
VRRCEKSEESAVSPPAGDFGSLPWCAKSESSELSPPPGDLGSTLECAKSEKSAVSHLPSDLTSLNSLSAQAREEPKQEPSADLSSLYSLTAQYVEQPERGPEQVFGLSDAWLARLKRQAATGNAVAAREAAELAEYLAKCDRGEIEIPPHPDEPKLIAWNRLCGERAKARDAAKRARLKKTSEDPQRSFA